MKISPKSGATIAAAAAALIMSTTFIAAPAAAAGEKVQCFGVNSCKGQGTCKTATNSCKGQNSCQGKGFVMLLGSDCTAKGGKTKQS